QPIGSTDRHGPAKPQAALGLASASQPSANRHPAPRDTETHQASRGCPPAPPRAPKPPLGATPRPPTPRPTAQAFTDAEQDLLDGVQRGTKDCEPVRGRGRLPKSARAGIECDSPDPAVARVGFYVFANGEAMINAYLSRMEAEGVE